MAQYVSFGDWVRRRRKQLHLTQQELADLVSCSPSMLRKIEGEERRPSAQLAGLLADHLGVQGAQRELFLQAALGYFTPELPDPAAIHIGQTPHQSEQARGERVREERAPEEHAPFVARERELRELDEHLQQTVAGNGRLVFVSGEAGRGKSSVLRAFAQRAMAARPDLLVACGSCDVYTGLGDPLLPFRDIFRMLTGDLENAGIRGIATRDLADRLAHALPQTVQLLATHGPALLDTLVPEPALEARLLRHAPESQAYSQLLFQLRERRAGRALSTPDMGQERLFNEVSGTLNAVARRFPLLLLLDDLHWADASSVGLLGHLVRRVRQSRILIVGSLRPEELALGGTPDRDGQKAAHPIQEVLSESRRQFGRNLIDLDRPQPDEELDFVNALLDQEPNRLGDDFRRQLARITEGNPLFMVELLRDMIDRRDIVPDADGRWVESAPLSWEHFPARIEGVIEKRVARLPAELRDLLTIASVQGQTFFTEVIAQVKQVDAGDLTRRLSAGLERRHRLIVDQGVRRVGEARISQYRFRHQLFQKYLYGRLASAERMYLHEDVGQALEAIYGSAAEDDLPAAQLARHFHEAQLGERASRYMLLAGRKAVQLIAFDEAAAHFERGLSLLETLPGSPEAGLLEFELTLALGNVQWHVGRVAESITTFEKAIEIARALGEPELFARAALGIEEPRWRLGLDMALSEPFMREALAKLAEEDSPLRVRLLVGLSRALLTAGEQEELRATTEQTIALARRLNDPLALCDALRTSVEVDRRPEQSAARLAALEEMIAVARSIDDHARLADALDLYIYDLLELGRMEAVDEAMAEQRRVAEAMRHAFQLHINTVFQTMRAIMRGEFEQAERLAMEAAEISRQLGIADLDGIFGIHLFTIRRQQGRLSEVAPLVRLYAAGVPASASWRPGLALIYAALNMKAECRAVFEELMAGGLRFVPQDSMRAASLAYLAEVCVYLGDPQRAATLYQSLLPFDGRAVVVGGATACYGAVARYLGMLATGMSDFAAAERHFEGALALDARMEAWPWLAHSRYEYASMLLSRGDEADHQRAQALLDQAQSAAVKMGMDYLAEQVAARRSG